MKNPIESIQQFCLIRLEILKTRELRLHKEIEDGKIQKEFLLQLLKDIGESRIDPNDNPISNFIKTVRRNHK